jgi:hypothetical protein
MDILLLVGVAFVALILGVGALMVLPVTLALAIIGWLIAGSAGALVGAAVAGFIGTCWMANAHG